MEGLLDIYERDYDPVVSVICFDERPARLIDDVVVPVAMKPGKVLREDCHYKRNGTCCVMMAIEPLAGKRIVEVKERRTKKDYALFMKRVEEAYKEAKQIILIQDNLNTHNPSSFYETFESEIAFHPTKRFQTIYTPKKASWLNMAEIELSSLSRQCLDRRIGNLESFSKEVGAWTNKRNEEKTAITWQFTKNDAREKLNKHYEIQEVNCPVLPHGSFRFYFW